MFKRTILLLSLCNSPMLQAEADKYLEENTVYCNSKQILADYLKFAEARDMTGLNLMVESGDCNFTPENTNTHLPSYQKEKINDTAVIEFEWQGKKVWTFEKLTKNKKLP